MRDMADRVRGLPLEEILRFTGAEQDRYDKHKWHTEQGTISVNGPKFMNWEKAFGGGGAIDLAMHLKGFRFKEAVFWLSHHFPGYCCRKQRNVPASSQFHLPAEDRSKLYRIKRYLIKDRCLPAVSVQSFIEKENIYSDCRGNAVFILHGKGNKPVGAELCGTGYRPWKGMASGSRKNRGYFSSGTACASTIILCESAIDAISCSVIYPEHLCISTAGARPHPHWLKALIYKGYEVYCGFDADPAGDTTACAMMAEYAAVKRLRPPLHDWNDVLKSYSTAWNRK